MRTGLPPIQVPRFVGRAAERAVLTGALARPPAAVFVTGEPGIGKSRLLRECLPAAGRALVAVCPPFREPLTLGAVVDAVRDATESVAGLGLSGLAGALRPVFPEWSDDLPPAPPPTEDASAARHRTFRALAELLGALELSVLVVEDVHWADDATLDFLLFLATRGLGGTSLVVSYRPEDVPAGSSLLRLSARIPAGTTQTRLELGPLGVDDTASLVSSMLAGEHVSAEFAAFLHQHTDGVPLAVEESVRLLRDRSDLIHAESGWVRRRLDAIEVPPSIRDAVLERASRLSADGQAVLRAAAVLAAPSRESVVASVSGVTAPASSASAIAEAVESGLLAEDERGLVSFRHALSARAVQEATAPPALRAAHLAAGEALQQDPSLPVARLARHFREAGDAERWARYAEEAADRAIASGDEAAAGAFLHELLVHTRLPAPVVTRLMGKLPFSSFTGDQFDALVRALRDWLGDPSLTPVEEAQLRFQLGRVYVVLAEYESGYAELERAVPHLPPDSREAARAMIFLGLPLERTQPPAAHLRWLHRAAELDLSSLASADRMCLHVDTTTALLMLGEESGWPAADRIPDEPATPEERRHVQTGHQNVGHVAMLWGRYAEAKRRLATALRLAERAHARDRSSLVGSTLRLAYCTGEWSGLAERAAALADGEDVPPVSRSEGALVAGLLAMAAGDRDVARERLGYVCEEARRGSGFERWFEAVAALARLRLDAGDAAGALAVTDEAMDILVRKQIWILATDLVPVRVDALLASGAERAAGELVAVFVAGLGGRAAPAQRAARTACRAALLHARGEPARAAVLFEDAARKWSALPRPYDALRAGQRAAECLLALGRVDDATAALTKAYQGCRDLGAAADAERCAALLRRYGVDVRRDWRRGRRGYGDRLSPREEEVVRLVATGRTNKEIAAVLGRSPKTVAGQLNSAMRKLGVSSRTALAVHSVAHGLAGTSKD